MNNNKPSNKRISKKESTPKTTKTRNNTTSLKSYSIGGISKKRLAVAIVLLIVLFLIVKMISFLDEKSKRNYTEPEEKSDYNISLSDLSRDAFFIDDYYFKSYDDGEITSKRGIDVSEHQGEINWQLVKESGVEFAYIRAAYRTLDNGNIIIDSRFKENIEGAIANDIEVGVYFFSQAITLDEAMDEAQFTAELIKDYKINLPVAFDMEEVLDHTTRIDELTNDERTLFADAFCTVIENYGYSSIIYGSPNWLLTKLNMLKIVDRSIWLANYVDYSSYPFKYDFWQYSESGIVGGIDVPVDLDIMFIRN